MSEVAYMVVFRGELADGADLGQGKMLPAQFHGKGGEYVRAG